MVLEIDNPPLNVMGAQMRKVFLETLAGLERMADKSAGNIIDAIDASKRRPFGRFVYALGIRQVGEHAAGLLAERFERLLILNEISESDLSSMGKNAHNPEKQRGLSRSVGSDQGNDLTLIH